MYNKKKERDTIVTFDHIVYVAGGGQGSQSGESSQGHRGVFYEEPHTSLLCYGTCHRLYLVHTKS